jgi:hypothetical protein
LTRGRGLAFGARFALGGDTLLLLPRQLDRTLTGAAFVLRQSM